MLFRLVRPVKRSGSSNSHFVQRIPADVRARAIGRNLAVPIGGRTHFVTITPKAQSIRFSLGTRDPVETKIRHAVAAAYLESVWRAFRETVQPVSLTHKQATALAGELYRAWANSSDEERPMGFTHRPDGGGSLKARDGRTWDPVRITTLEDAQFAQETEAGAYRATAAHLDSLRRDGKPGELEGAVGPIVDRLLLKKGIASVTIETRLVLIDAFILALRDAMVHRERNAKGDYSPDPQAERFPRWDSPPSITGTEQAKAGTSKTESLMRLVEDWWQEARATGRKPSTHESYRNTMTALRSFLGHEDALRVTPEDVIRFKKHRLATVNPRTGKTISAKTVKDSDLAGLKTVFGWAVSDLRMPTNPAAGISLKVAKPIKLRSKSFTEAEASAILTAAANLVPAGEQPWTFAAKRWVPWLCAYTGARVGELAQLRKQDVRQEGEHWVIRVTPEAGTVKTNEAREIVLHPHIIEQGFAKFVAAASAGHLFLKVGKKGDVLGPLQGTKNRIAEFARSIVSDPNVAPNHGWRHRFKTVGMEAEIDHRILDAIQGQAARSVAETYGEVTLRTNAAAIAKLPRIVIDEE